MAEQETKRPTRKLTVKNFSVIKDAELEFGKITILIGPQASGKSLLCKLAYFFEQYVSELVLNAGRNQLSLNQTEEQIIESFLSYFPENIEGKTFHIQYQIDPSFSLSIGMTDTSRTPYLEWKNREFIYSFKNWLSARSQRPPSFNSDRRRELMSGVDIGPMPIESDSVYIPTGRAFFSTPNRALAALSTKNLDWITNRFATDFDAEYSALRESYQTNRVLLRNIGSSSTEILKGRVIKDDSRLIFESIQDGRRLPFEILSSGTLELLPIFNILAQVAKKTGDPVHPNMPSPTVGMVFTEEPELSVFPETQYQFAKLIALLAKSDLLWKSYAITTHSPYILSSFNNLILAGQLGMDKRLKKKIKIDEQFWIEPDSFKAYSIHDGKLESILSKSGLINGEYLDSVSEAIGKEFDELLRLEYGKQKAS
ncbi:AAA family ATPase [Terracidiphilus sp.]|uniref:AAA family ATPase n=1 Tax=Terracidiphilus sp. TaxID=1964191 RepID=UPI003C14EF2A